MLDRSLNEEMRTRQSPSEDPNTERCTVRLSEEHSGQLSLVTAHSTDPAQRGAERRSYRGTGGKAAPRGGSARARQQRALRRARASRSGEALRCSMAATCGGKSAAVTHRPARTHRPCAGAPRGNRPGLAPRDSAGRGAATVTSLP